MNTINKIPIKHSASIARLGCLHIVESFLNCRVSYIYAVAAEIKNIAMFSQSGDFPITPL